MENYIVFFWRFPHPSAKPVKSFVFVVAADEVGARVSFRELYGSILTIIGRPVRVCDENVYYTVPSKNQSQL